jgi:hypothetical protein
VTQESLVVIIGTAVTGGLVSAVVFLFKLFVEEKKTTRADLQECRSDREKLWAKIEQLQTEIGKLLRGQA